MTYKNRRALITGITGQDGSYLAELLLKKGYEIHGLVRRSSASNEGRISHLMGGDLPIYLHQGDLSDSFSLKRILELAQPQEIYNLAAMSHVKISFDIPEYTADVDGVGVLRLLEAMKHVCPKAKLYQASTSELYGKVRQTPQNEATPFHPRSPYGIAKLFAYWAVINYREAYSLFACNGILFNHESPRRGEAFVSRKITLGVARIRKGLQKKLILGNLDSERDWGYAADFVEGMWRMLQRETPEDFVLATGIKTTVRRFVEMAFEEIGIQLTWDGKGLEEKGIDASTGEVMVEISPEFFRPVEVDLLLGDAAKARLLLGWSPTTSIAQLVKLMVLADVGLLDAIPSEGKCAFV